MSVLIASALGVFIVGTLVLAIVAETGPLIWFFDLWVWLEDRRQ